MILENKGEEFKMHFNAKEYTIPEGKFEVADNLGSHVIIIAKKWGKTVAIVSKTPDGGIVPEKKEEPVMPIKEEIVEEEAVVEDTLPDEDGE